MNRKSPLSALTDVAWIRTSVGPKTVEETLLNAHTLNLDTTQPAVDVDATLRFLTHIVALVVREDPNPTEDGGFSPVAVTTALQQLEDATRLGGNPEDTSFMSLVVGDDSLGGGRRPAHTMLRKLSPGLHPNNAKAFWDLSTPDPTELPAAEACQALVTYASAFPTGNNKLHGVGGRGNGAAIFGVEAGKRPMVDVWVTGPTLYDTLLMNTPTDWVDKGGLPAWGDREAQQGETPLWKASWTPNTVGTQWGEDGSLLAVVLGGVPTEWLPQSVATELADDPESKAVRAWLDDRALTANPPALWYTNKKGEQKRLYLTQPETSVVPLATSWMREGHWTQLEERTAGMVEPASPDASVWMIWLQVDGSGTAPSVRASHLLTGDHPLWLPKGEVADRLTGFGTILEKIVWSISSPFRKDTLADEARRERGETTWSLNINRNLEQPVQDVVKQTFWDNVEQPLLDAATHIVETGETPTTIIGPTILGAAEKAWTAGLGLLPPGNLAVREQSRGSVFRTVRRHIKNL